MAECQRCVMDSTDPALVVDEYGICNHCRRFETLKPAWDVLEKTALDQVVRSVQIAQRNSKYDCVIGLSGGVDSSYLALFLRREYPDLRILAIHVDSGWNSEAAVSNIEKIVKNLEIDLYTHVVEWDEIKDLQKAYLKSGVPNQDIPQDHVFYTSVYRIARRFKIKYYFNGGNYATESVLPSSWGYDNKDGRQIKEIHRQFGSIKLKRYRIFGLFESLFIYRFFYKIKKIRPLNFIEYNRSDAISELQESINWKDYGGKHHESRFTKFFQNYYLPARFGFDKRRAHLSSLILSGQISRQQAEFELKNSLYDDLELSRDKRFIATKLDMAVAEIDELMLAPLKRHSDYTSSQKTIQLLRRCKKMLE